MKHISNSLGKITVIFFTFFWISNHPVYAACSVGSSSPNGGPKQFAYDSGDLTLLEGAVTPGCLGEVVTDIYDDLNFVNDKIDSGLQALNERLDSAITGYKQGLASVAAMANIPKLDRDKIFSVGVGAGGFAGEHAYALGAAARVTDNFVVNGSASRAFNSGSGFGSTTWGVGGALSW